MAAARRASPVPCVSLSSSPGPLLGPHARLSQPRALSHCPCAVSRPVTGTVLRPVIRVCEPAAAHRGQGRPQARWPWGHSRWPNTWALAACQLASPRPALLPQGCPAEGQAAGLALGWSWESWQGGAPVSWPPPRRVPRVHCAEAWDGLPLLAERHGGEAGQDRSARGLLRSPSRGVPRPAQRRNREGGPWGWGRGFPGPGRVRDHPAQTPQRTDSRGHRPCPLTSGRPLGSCPGRLHRGEAEGGPGGVDYCSEGSCGSLRGRGQGCCWGTSPSPLLAGSAVPWGIPWLSRAVAADQARGSAPPASAAGGPAEPVQSPSLDPVTLPTAFSSLGP